MSPGTPERRRRLGVAAGTAAPLLFLAISFALAIARRDVIAAQGWASWPSSMGIGGWSGFPQILAFLLLAGAYPLFAWWAIRPVLGRGHLAFAAIALGELLLAFPTDARGTTVSWHGVVHLIGVLVVTCSTGLATVVITVATRHRPQWRPWRSVGVPSVSAGVLVGAAAGFHTGWAKVFFVVAITLPIPLLARLIAGEQPPRSDSLAR